MPGVISLADATSYDNVLFAAVGIVVKEGSNSLFVFLQKIALWVKILLL